MFTSTLPPGGTQRPTFGGRLRLSSKSLSFGSKQYSNVANLCGSDIPLILPIPRASGKVR